MCILSLFQGHSDSCECDKCQEPVLETEPEATYTQEERPATLAELVEETEANQASLLECVKTMRATISLMSEVTSEVQELKALVKVSHSTPAQGSFQPVSADCIITTLCGALSNFRYGLQPLAPVQTNHWKSSRFSLRFTALSAEGQPLPRRLVFLVAAYRAIAPPALITGGIRTKTFLRGQCLQSTAEGVVTFDKLSFAEVSSNFPGKTVLLVVVCKNDDSVQPYVSPPIKVISRY